tara:strand:- start:334 stop:1113 length:780 start_codon:yes stop_codon:yes gene_type:complete
MVLTKTAIQRIAKDVKYIINNPIENIYYKHDTEKLTKGYALLLGNKNTPYSNGNYLFEFTFPDNYPYEPPKLKFLTSDGLMRFHPNLYINGKVCLSIINTWNGEGWTSCNNINSILLILISILDNNSLTYEPGIEINHYNVSKYNTLVAYKNIEFCILKQINMIYDLNENNENNENSDNINKIQKCLLLFKDEIISNFNNNYKFILDDLDNIKTIFYKKTTTNNIIYISSYALQFKLDFNKLKDNLINLHKNINNLLIN